MRFGDKFSYNMYELCKVNQYFKYKRVEESRCEEAFIFDYDIGISVILDFLTKFMCDNYLEIIIKPDKCLMGSFSCYSGKEALEYLKYKNTEEVNFISIKITNFTGEHTSEFWLNHEKQEIKLLSYTYFDPE